MKETCLNKIEPGECACVLRLENKGSMRRRLLDIGIIKGTEIKCVGRNASGSLSAYLIRGAIIAIRSSDSGHIVVEYTR
jgi:ferrous iron transport protein A